VHLVDALHDPAGADLLAEARALGLHLEVCPTSNVHTGAARSVASHPITALWRAGVSLSYHTDNRLMSCISLAEEAAALLTHTPLTETDLLQMAVQAAEHSFLPPPARAAAAQALRQWALGRGPSL
jgi:adenosine deaminase